MKVEMYFLVKTYSNGLTRIESGPYYSHMDALMDKEKRILYVFDNDYSIAKTELEMELV